MEVITFIVHFSCIYLSVPISWCEEK